VSRTIAIVGGGLAGIAAALRIAEGGLRPILIETRRRLGGRATSFVDPRTQETLDNCQHVVTGACTNLLDLYARLGVLDRIDWHRSFRWARPPGRPDRLGVGLLPAPMHMAGSFLRMRSIGVGDKVAIARAMWRMLRIGPAGRVLWRDRTFLEFLRETRQTARTIERFWEPVVVSACNLSVERVGAAWALQVFQQGFLAHRFAPVMGISSVPLVDLYDPAAVAIEAVGGAAQIGVSARAIAFDGQRVTGVVTEDGFVPAAAVISAVPPDRLEKLVSAPLRAADRRLQRLGEFEFSPILGVHLRFERRILEWPHLVLPGRRTQWLFDKGTDADGRQHVHAVISAADDWMALDEAEIVERVLADIHASLPGSIGLRPISARSVKEKRATFAVVPGVDGIRPSAAPGTVGSFATAVGGRMAGGAAANGNEPGGGVGVGSGRGGGGGVRNLYLAGDWCDTGWPATMEGAVRSGYEAAAAIVGEGGVVPDLPTAPISRWLGLRDL